MPPVLQKLTPRIAVRTNYIGKGRVQGINSNTWCISPLLHICVSLFPVLISNSLSLHAKWIVFGLYSQDTPMESSSEALLSPVCCQQSKRQKSGMNSPSKSLLILRSPKYDEASCQTTAWVTDLRRWVSMANINPNYSESRARSLRIHDPLLELDFWRDMHSGHWEIEETWPHLLGL